MKIRGKSNNDGTVVQLGERCPCKAEVEGSTPSRSTNAMNFRSVNISKYRAVSSSGEDSRIKLKLL